MYGLNPIRKRHESDGRMLAVKEMFYTIQGEGPFAGTPAFFVRMIGCNLQCSFCDTVFDEEGTIEYPSWDGLMTNSVESIVTAAQAELKQSRLVVLTGGEPFLQNLTPLIYALLSAGLTVQVETNGTVSPQHIPPWMNSAILDGRLSIVISPKTPSVSPEVSSLAIAWKYIIKAEEQANDGLPFYDVSRHRLLARPLPGFPKDSIFVQPCDYGEDSEVSIMLNRQAQDEAVRSALLYGYRISLQQHKYLNLR